MVTHESMPAPTPLVTSSQLPVTASIVLPRRSVLGSRRSQIASIARFATASYVGSPVNLLNTPNSMTRLPAPAVHVSVRAPFGTPFRRFTRGCGIPVGDLSNAGRSRAADRIPIGVRHINWASRIDYSLRLSARTARQHRRIPRHKCDHAHAHPPTPRVAHALGVHMQEIQTTEKQDRVMERDVLPRSLASHSSSSLYHAIFIPLRLLSPFAMR